MKNKMRHISGLCFAGLVLLFLVGNNWTGVKPDAESHKRFSIEESFFLSSGIDGSLNAVQTENLTSGQNYSNVISQKNQFGAFTSVYSKTADLLLKSKTMAYIHRFKSILIHPQIFDILFPFHYYS